MKILLFDMDGVLLQSLGYHIALQHTVEKVGRTIGCEHASLSEQHIAGFESHGMTCEWHSAALCTSYLFLQAKWHQPDLTYPISLQLDTPILLQDGLDPAPLFDALVEFPSGQQPQLHRAVSVMASVAANAGLPADEYAAIVAECENPSCSLTFRCFQEMVLGSQYYQQTYHLPSALDCQSYLSLYDRILISETSREELSGWLNSPDHYAAIITNRPSSQIPGTASTPEAELGAKLVGLQQLPLIGFGEVFWLSQQVGQESTGLNKPSPVHSLAALQAALGTSLPESMKRAYQIVQDPYYSEGWQQLAGADIYLFEDTITGVISLEKAYSVLTAAGIKPNIHKLGITDNCNKQTALKQWGAANFSDINLALKQVLDR